MGRESGWHPMSSSLHFRPDDGGKQHPPEPGHPGCFCLVSSFHLLPVDFLRTLVTEGYRV